MHPPPSYAGMSASSLTTSASCLQCCTAAHGNPSHTPPASWVALISQLRRIRALWAPQFCTTTLAPHRLCTRPHTAALRFPGYLSSPSRRYTRNLFGDALLLSSAHSIARRYASTARRPTFIEISEALDVLGVGIDEDPKVLKKKYRELAMKNHPDAGGDAATMAKVTVAYDRLSSLSNREKEEYKLQKKMYHSGGLTGARRYRPGPSRNGGFNYAAPNGPFQARAADMYGQYYQQDANNAYRQAHQAGQQSFWNRYYNRAGSNGFTENPFNASNPFSMHAQSQRVRFMPPGTLLLQGLVVYLVFSAFFLFLYRRYRDWRQDDGWRMSESLARHEQMQEMHRIRQEMNERARGMLVRDGGGAAADAGPFSGLNALYGGRQYVGESPEARALEYARQRRIQMMQEQQEAALNAPELRGWPKIDEEKGHIIKRAQDPPGVVFFEPRQEDARRRQIEKQRRANGFTRRDKTLPPAATPDSHTGPVAAVSDQSNTESVNGSEGTGTKTSRPLPPETNTSSIIMKPVGSDQEAQAVMRGIFEGLRRNSS